MSDTRRPLASRNINFFQSLAQGLIKIGLSPNQVSILSIVFSALAALCFYTSSSENYYALFLILGALFVQLRLLCNLVDGLMAVEGGLKSPVGEVYNDFPDRISDVLTLLGMGYGAAVFMPWTPTLAWAASVGAVMTAYVRVLGASIGAGHFFSGPMAKPQRMFLVTLGGPIWALERAFNETAYTPVILLALIGLGTVWTSGRRLRQIVSYLYSEK